jgi:hypothetical protein
LNTEIGIADEFDCRISGCHPDMPRRPTAHTDIQVAKEYRKCNHSTLASVGFARIGPARGPHMLLDSHREASVAHLRNKTGPIRLEGRANCIPRDYF